MKERSATSLMLLTAFIALILLLGWSITGPVLGGTTPGGKDGEPSSPEGPSDEPGPPGPPDPNPDPDPDPDPDPPWPDDPRPDEPRPRPPEQLEDSDGDFIPDDLEPNHKTDKYDWDSDDDHIADSHEDGNTNPNKRDTDNDGI